MVLPPVSPHSALMELGLSLEYLELLAQVMAVAQEEAQIFLYSLV